MLIEKRSTKVSFNFQVIRQTDVNFSNLLTKIGNGENLSKEEQNIIESRFRTSEWCLQHHREAVRLFPRVVDVTAFNNTVRTQWHSVAADRYTGSSNQDQIESARRKVHRMKGNETLNMLFDLPLALDEPYMIITNLDIPDKLVNGTVGYLRRVDFASPRRGIDEPGTSADTALLPARLWLDFGENNEAGQLTSTKARQTDSVLGGILPHWVPIYKRTATFPVSRNSKICCHRETFPLNLARAMTIHKSQGSTFDTVVVAYDSTMSQQLVYVALSRVKTLEGMFLTNAEKQFTFFHASPKITPKFQQLQSELQRLSNHPFETIDQLLLQKFETRSKILLNLNVQSLNAHHLDITSDTVLMKASIYCFTETWNSHESQVHCEGLRLVSQNKRPSRTGGVAIYVKDSLNFE